jgi:antitoxin (DNA-binding transcriptional repressor) of toxin-antitoxin stability system
MNFHQVTLALLIAAVLSGGALAASEDEAAALTTQIQTMDASATTKGASPVTGKIAADFEAFAGSNENSTALVTGLRNGSEITLTQKGEPSATFTPATKPMGYGNVSTSLALAKYQLVQQGITNPTPEQLQTALNGGAITIDGKTVEYQGVLQMRADGLGWGQIAQQLGTKLGPVVSGIKAQNARIATLPAATSATSTTTTGVTTASGARSSAGSSGHKGASGGRGVVTAGGAPSSGGGSANKGASGGKGIVTAGGGTVSGASNGRSTSQPTTAGGGASAPRGEGIVTAAGQGGSPVAHGVTGGTGAGVVNASGTAAGASSGAGSGNGKALGRGK